MITSLSPTGCLRGGELLLKAEPRAGKAVCVIGATVIKKSCSAPQDPLGNKLRLKNVFS